MKRVAVIVIVLIAVAWVVRPARRWAGGRSCRRARSSGDDGGRRRCLTVTRVAVDRGEIPRWATWCRVSTDPSRRGCPRPRRRKMRRRTESSASPPGAVEILTAQVTQAERGWRRRSWRTSCGARPRAAGRLRRAGCAAGRCHCELRGRPRPQEDRPARPEQAEHERAQARLMCSGGHCSQDIEQARAALARLRCGRRMPKGTRNACAALLLGVVSADRLEQAETVAETARESGAGAGRAGQGA